MLIIFYESNEVTSHKNNVNKKNCLKEVKNKQNFSDNTLSEGMKITCGNNKYSQKYVDIYYEKLLYNKMSWNSSIQH